MPISTYIFPAKVADGFVGDKEFARTKIKATFVSVQTAFFGDVVRDDFDHHLICMSTWRERTLLSCSTRATIARLFVALFLYATTRGLSDFGRRMSAFGGKADIASVSQNVRL